MAIDASGELKAMVEAARAADQAALEDAYRDVIDRYDVTTIDLDIELEFTKNDDGTINGNLIGTTLGEIDKPLRDFSIEGRRMDFTFPNVDPWNASLTLTEEGTLEGGIFNIQGTMPVTFRKTNP